ncbi:cysteine desulfurase [Candidatus Methylospira mobilis]|uniref:cysteine desulfurase n=1 Tax=Candidatus Methylospira mobilis TaxID=1808979 RepID=A0A5Q0BFS9_9GAMM|nr:family 2A encapsulin nanocompartment cargo protein cysteine desulfurase [Candidatus Methylospira mobilis]QFY42725.1 cysteine desulfurase [Candidatus Methylospira mobilis]WNV04150.1 family 2A encapsulin nanocompartment cargo protein cysteine desulfurase [Candidatus Methylospira mobilis]WNV04795.1 family 2A encapsulin nanocompartment cargo protein cysteine desulfurase [Candidatus Methylospira mobilis]
MNTSNVGIDALTHAIPAGLPSVEELAQLANQLFSQVPGSEGSMAEHLQAGRSIGSTGGAGLPPALPVRPNELDPVESYVPPEAATQGRYSECELAKLANQLFSQVPGSEGSVAEHAQLGRPSGVEVSGAPFAQALPAKAEPAAIIVPVGFDVPGVEWNDPLHGLDLTSPAPAGYALPYSAPAQPASPAAFYFVDQLSPQGRDAYGPIAGSAHPPFDVYAVRRDFPILQERVNGKPLIWFDNAATTQKPQVVIDRLSYFYQHENSNIHRAAHELAARATDAYEGARETVRSFINAGSADEVIFVRGTTEGINLIAKSWGRQNLVKDDEIVITWLEHHANIVPWQQLCAETGAILRVVPVDDNGQVILEAYERLLGPRTRLVSFTQVSNALGTVTPAKNMVEMAHRYGARVLVDGAQSVAHMATDVQALDCDWFVFSGHKVFGPTGIGAVYGKAELLEATQPWQGGGNMIEDVTFEQTRYQHPPNRFEAGTGNIADAVGLGAALEYLQKIGVENAGGYEHELLVYATQGLNTVPGLTLIGTAPDKASVLSFILKGYRTEDIGAELNRAGIAVRSGHHCAQPILRRFGLETTVRPSLALYNTREEVDALVSALLKISGGGLNLQG